MRKRWYPPVRAGLNATRIILPLLGSDDAGTEAIDSGSESNSPATIAAYLLARFSQSRDDINKKIARGDIYASTGEPISRSTPYQPGEWVFLYRDPPADEPTVLALNDIEILYQDEQLLVIDKPHQVSVIPRGRWVTQTALVHLRNTLNLPNLSPLHRLDRPTAGILVFSLNPAERGKYQMLFQNRQVSKEYLAVASKPKDLTQFPLEVSSRIVKERGIPRAQEISGEPNAFTYIEVAATKATKATHATSDTALYRLKPNTGKTHQLRLHMNSLGLPIVGDPFWPVLHPDLLADQTPEIPLQLLAHRLEFTDPLTGERRIFESRRGLAAWSANLAPY